jgi:hypothetical protein
MRQSVFGLLGLATALGGCDIGQRTRVESLYTTPPPTQIVQIAVDDTHVYWTESTTIDDTTTDTIKSVPKKALPPAPPAELEHGKLITVEAGTIWFADAAGNVSRRDPQPPTVTSLFMPADASPIALVRDDNNIYEGIAIGNPATSWEIWAIPRGGDGSDRYKLASDVTDTFSLEDMISDGDFVYFSVGSHADVPNGEIRRVPGAGGDVEVVAGAPLPAEPRTLRKFDAGIFWYGVEQVLDDGSATGAIKGRLFRTESDGSEPYRGLISITGPTSLAVDDKFVYWIDVADTSVWVERISQFGGHLTSLVPLTPAGASTAVTVDDTYVYWSDQGAPTAGLNRMHKN